MPAEVETLEGKSPSRVEIENVDEKKQGTVGSTVNESVANGISHGGNDNGNCNGDDKEETDGSYVFVTENDTVGNDPVASDTFHDRICDFVRPSDANVEKDGHGFVEGENGNPGEQKMEISQESQTMVESEADRADDGLIEAVMEITKSEMEGPRDGDLGNGKGENLESTEEVEPIQESEVEPRGLQEKSECQINTGRKIDVEVDQGNNIEGQDKSDMDVDFSKDLQHSEDAERPIESNVGMESEFINEETSLDDPKDDGLILEQSVDDPKDDGLILVQSVQADSGCNINVSESVKAPDSEDDDIRSESTAVAEPVSVERDNSEGDALMVSEAEKAQPSRDAADATTELGVPNVNGDAKAETHNLTVPSLDEDASKQSESQIAEVQNSVSDEGVELEPEAADISASDERSDVIGLAKENDSGAAIADGLSCATQQEPKHTEPSELVETPSSPSCLEGPATENETNGQGSSEDGELDIKQETKDESVLLGQEATDMNEKFSHTGQNQESSMEVNCGTEADGCPTSAEEAESSQTGGLPRKVSDEGAKSLSTSLSETLIGLDSETMVPKLAENSVNGAADEMNATAFEPEGVQSGRTCSELNDDLPTPEHSKIDIEVEENSKVNGTEDIPKDVCEATSEEVCEPKVSNIKKGSVMNAAEEVESGTKSFYNTEFPLLSNGKVEAEVVSEPQEKDNESRWATACFASKTRTSIPNLEPEVTVSTDTTGTGNEDMNSEAVAESTDSKLADQKGGSDVIENGNRTSTSADETDAKVASTCEGSDGQSVNLQVDGETQKDQVSTCGASGGQSANLQVDAETRKDRLLASSGEVYTLDASEGQAIAAEIERKPFYFLPRVPRYDGENLAEQLKHAETQVDEKTQTRDAIGAEIQKIKISCKEVDANLKAAIAEERSARKALQSKRQEIESLQSVINRVKSAASVDDIGSKVHSMEHMIQHETLTLNEEKQLIREIKQLKQLCEQISSNMGTQDEVQQALDNQEKTEERLKAIRKELDVLRNDLSKAQAVTKAARKGYDEEWEKQSKLQKQFRDADAVRQEAYVLLQSLRKQLREKNKYFFKYRDDLKAAIEMALTKDREALQSFCLDQVETFMNLWNNNDEFRKNYIRCNVRSTLRRLGTLDGRALGPDEEPPQIPRAKTDRADKLRSSNVRPETHQIVPPASAHQEKVTQFEDSKTENAKAVAKPTEQKGQTTKSKKPAKSMPPPIDISTSSSGEGMEESRIEKEEEEKPKLTKEEEDKLRKAEEKREMEEAMKLKEQSRLEEIAKAKEAMERKKKREEKAKARFALRTQKEAEEKEKEREKKLRKKERKGIAESREIPLPSSDAQSETPKENEPPEEKITATIQPKKSQKPSQFLKQTKTKSIPPPLRNRSSKRRLKQYMWVALVAVVVLVVFLLGNANLSFSPSNLWFLI